MGRIIVILLFGILCGSANAEKNFYNNEICTTDKDCTALNKCDSKFGCVASAFGLGVIAFVVFLVFCALIAIIVCSFKCSRSRRNIFRPHNQYLPQTIITTNAPAWNQQQTGVTTTTVYPHNPQPNQFYTDSVNPPAYNSLLTDNRPGAGVSVNQMPTAPPAGYA